MGGFGSGRRSNKKQTVESCRTVIDIREWVRLKVIHNNCRQSGRWSWTKSGHSMSVTVDTVARDPVIQICYWLLTHQSNELIRLTTTQPYFGGVRWWFACPGCRRRVGKLYRPQGKDQFACRHCHDLTYWSSQSCHCADPTEQALKFALKVFGTNLADVAA